MSAQDDESQQAVRDQLGDVAEGVTGEDQLADQSAVAADLAANGGQAANPDVSELLAAVQKQAEQLAALQQQIDARQAAEQTTEAKPPSLLEALGSSTIGSQVAHLFAIVEERLAALEGKE